jgi:L-aminopeptidase/D-esterase-like protein
VINGFEIGHCTADGNGWLTGTTVILARSGAVGGVDVRGGGPGTRETDLLDPTAMVEQVHAVVLTGGSAYGLAAADGVMAGLEEAGIGFPVGPEPGHIVPIVPAAVIFDLNRGGVFANRPTADFGRRALAAASADRPLVGCVGAGTGARCGGIKGGFGYAERATLGGVSVAAAVVVNATGSPIDPSTGRLWADRQHRLGTPNPADREALAATYTDARPSLATTIGVVLTDAALTKAQATKVAAIAHDGMARAIRPIHSMMDGDTAFCLASGAQPSAADPYAALVGFNALLTAAAEVFSDACLDALLAADGRAPWRSYRQLAPSAFAD